MNQAASFMRGPFLLACVFLPPILITISRGVSYSRFITIADVKNYSTDENRDIFNTFDNKDQNDKGFPIDPFDLMNRIKRAGAMKDATTASDALDEALSAFDESEY